jgi:hypothetical protein
MLPLPSGKSVEFRSQAVTLTHGALKRARAVNATVILGEMYDGVLTVESAWPREDWEQLTVHDVRALVGGSRLLTAGLWLVETPTGLHRRGLDPASLLTPYELATGAVPPMPGIYVFETSELQDVRLECNNKAHYLSGDFVRRLMLDAARRGRYVPVPMWPAIYADLTPPNLYQVQKERFDELFRARRRN